MKYLCGLFFKLLNTSAVHTRGFVEEVAGECGFARVHVTHHHPAEFDLVAGHVVPGQGEIVNR